MSLSLDIDTKPKGLTAKTIGPPLGVETVLRLGAYEIGLQDFLVLAAYVITNTNLAGETDPRLAFLKACEHARIEKGFGGGDKRIELDYPPSGGG